MKNALPQSVRATLWSYSEENLDKDRDKNLIIFQVLNYGTEDATKWLKQTYTSDELVEVVRNSHKSSWSKKSLNYWSLVLGVTPLKTSRFA